MINKIKRAILAYIRKICGTKQLDNNVHTLEYKLWQFNTLNNQILYTLLQQQKTKKKNFRPLVSIIIPVYNGSNYLEETIKCALAQTYKNIEIIVVNDGSTDDGASRKIAEKYTKKIKYFEKENGGVSSALNLGIEKMKGEYFSWLSHDDLITPDHIEKLVEHVSYVENDNDIPYVMFDMVDENGYFLPLTFVEQIHCNDFKVSLLKNEWSLLQGEINGGSVLIPKRAFDEFGLFDEKQRITQERDMWSRLIRKYHFVNLPFTTASIRTHSKQVTNTNPKVIEETNRKNLEILSNMSDDIKCKLAGSVDGYYENLKRFYKNSYNAYMVEEITKIQEQDRQRLK